MAFGYGSPTNVFMPQADAGGMIVAFARDPSKFPLAKYVQYAKAKEPVFYYLRLDVDSFARLVAVADNVWAPGNDRPAGTDNHHKHDFKEVRTIRYGFTTQLGDLTVDFASWNIKQSHLIMLQQQAMTQRTQLVATLLTTTSNWASATDFNPSNHYADANALNGGAGPWNLSSEDATAANGLAIKKSILEAVRRIHIDTNSIVVFDDLVLIVNPTLAEGMANSGEVNNYLKSSPVALAQVRGDEPNQNQQWGLPERIYGLPIVVENTSKASNRPGATSSRSFVWPDATAVIASRKGGLEFEGGGPSFSTCQMYFLEEATVETMQDTTHRRVTVGVTENYKEVLAAPAAGFCITNCM